MIVRKEPKYVIRRRVALLTTASIAAFGGYVSSRDIAKSDATTVRYGVLRPSRNVTNTQCSPSVTPCHDYKPAFVLKGNEGFGKHGDLVVDCDHPNIWCDDEGS